jgi:hypothetical protein
MQSGCSDEIKIIVLYIVYSLYKEVEAFSTLMLIVEFDFCFLPLQDWMHLLFRHILMNMVHASLIIYPVAVILLFLTNLTDAPYVLW